MAHLTATTPRTPGATAPNTPALELNIDIDARLGLVIYEGSAAQLQGEPGLLPAGFEWPKGFDGTRWMAGGHECSIKRQRPAGAKGPRAQFMASDHWRLVMSTAHGHGPTLAQRGMHFHAQALAQISYAESPAGRMQLDQQFDAVVRAWRDPAYMRFMKAATAHVPTPKRRGRPAKATPTTPTTPNTPTQGATV